jgi:hypothetical protein
MLVHGGGFVGGSCTSMQDRAIYFARRGFVAASLDYRLGWAQTCDGLGYVTDVKAIYRAVQDHVAEERVWHGRLCRCHARCHRSHLLFVAVKPFPREKCEMTVYVIFTGVRSFEVLGWALLILPEKHDNVIPILMS